MRKEAFFCSCGLNSHFLVLTRFDDEEDMVYLAVHRTPPSNFLERVIGGIKYIFGITDDPEFTPEICLNKKTMKQIESFLCE